VYGQGEGVLEGELSAAGAGTIQVEVVGGEANDDFDQPGHDRESDPNLTGSANILDDADSAVADASLKKGVVQVHDAGTRLELDGVRKVRLRAKESRGFVKFTDPGVDHVSRGREVKWKKRVLIVIGGDVSQRERGTDKPVQTIGTFTVTEYVGGRQEGEGVGYLVTEAVSMLTGDEVPHGRGDGAEADLLQDVVVGGIAVLTVGLVQEEREEEAPHGGLVHGRAIDRQ